MKKVKTVKSEKVKNGKVNPMFTPAHQAYIASLKERIAELEIRLSGIPGNSILAEAEHLTTRDRNESYGHPGIEFGKVADAFNAMTGHRITARQAITFMVVLKLVRENFQSKRDNRVDAAGYLNCLDMAVQAIDQRLIKEFTTGSHPDRSVTEGLQGAETTEKAGPAVPVGTLVKEHFTEGDLSALGMAMYGIL